MHNPGAPRRGIVGVYFAVMYGRPPVGKDFFGVSANGSGAVMYTASRCGL